MDNMTTTQPPSDFSQTKLTKSEWESIEKPVLDQEKQVLKLIQDGYNNIDIKINENNSIVSFMKIEYTAEIEVYLYNKYFIQLIDNIIVLGTPITVKPIISSKIKILKKIDMMRINHMDSTIEQSSQYIFEFKQLEFCKIITKCLNPTKEKKSVKKNPECDKTTSTFYLYTLIQLCNSTIPHINKYIMQFVNNFIQYHIRDEKLLVESFSNSYHIIEKNPHILKFNDKTLYDHQKQLFQLFKKEREDNRPKLVLYTAPTGTGKTMSPLGLSNGYKIIYICAARHVGLALARSAISMEKRVAFAFGCETATDIRLHYYSAVEFTKNRKSGGIYKVDNSDGSKVEIMICDVGSYITAMHYMFAFHKESEIILYWDEPTITLDLESHPLHTTIHHIWKENRVSKIILSCATLPKEEEIQEVLLEFRERFDNAEILSISSYDCKKSISILDNTGKTVLPHLLFENYSDIHQCVLHCQSNRSILRYFDLREIVRMVEYCSSIGAIPEPYLVNNYFRNIYELTMNNIKNYYLDVIDNLDSEKYKQIHNYLTITHKPMFISNIPGTHITKIKSLDIAPVASGETISRTYSQCGTIQPINTCFGVLLTTTDAHTLTDGPTIFLTEDVSKIGKFYIQQTKIPPKLFDGIMDKIMHNNKIQKKMDILSNSLDDSLGKGKEKESEKGKGKEKTEKDNRTDNEAFNPEAKRLMNCIEVLRAEIKMISMEPIFIANTKQHQNVWVNDIVENAFIPQIDEEYVKRIMILDVDTQMKLLLLLGIGVFDTVSNTNISYMEIMKTLASEQKLYLIIASSDYIYGTNYQLCHGFLGKDLLNMTQQKIIQAMGRIGRNNIQQEYTIRFRDNSLLRKLFLPSEYNMEAINICKLFIQDKEDISLVRGVSTSTISCIDSVN
jgi:hypothetical protein